MKIIQKLKFTVFITFISVFMANTSCTKKMQPTVISLDQDWQLQPLGKWNEEGKLTEPDVYTDKNVVNCKVPNTVMGALTESGKYADIYFSDNLERIPTEWFKNHWRYLKKFDVIKNDEVIAKWDILARGKNY